MNKSFSVFYIIASYYLLTYIFYIFKIESFIKDILVAPLFFLVPAGLGLLVFSVFNTHNKLLKSVTGLQIILAAAFWGFLSISLLYTELNNHEMLASIFILVYPTINILSLFGFYRVSDMLYVNDTFREFRNICLMILPLFLIVYYFLFIHFSPYPFRDIFMEVHFMKGALEFSRFKIINLSTGDSYIALLQVHSGLLHHFFNYNLINSQWILPAYLFFVYFLCFYCFYSSFISDRFVLTIALGLNTIFTSLMFSNSNNSYLIMVTVLFFSVLISTNTGRKKAIPILIKMIILSALSLILFMNRGVPSYHGTLFPLLSFYMLIMLVLSYFNIERLIPLSFVILLMMIAPPYHRAASLYIPLMIMLYAVYFVCFQLEFTNNHIKNKLLMKILISAVLCTPVIVCIEMMVTMGWPPSPMHKIQEILNPIFLYIVNQRVSDNQGVIGTTAEFLRFVPPLVYLILALLILDLVRNRKTGLTRKFIEDNMSNITFCAVSALLLLIFLYSPLPNVHRVLVFPVLMIFALTAILFKYYYEKYYLTCNWLKPAVTLAVIIALYTLITKFIYDLPWKYPDVSSPYIAELVPIPQVGWIIMVISLVALLFFRKAALVTFFTVLILLSGLFLDRFNIVTKLYGNAYGYEFPQPKIISHYSVNELRTAEQLGQFIKSPDNLMFSDPSTLGIFEARTGINGFYTFSNLGLMLEQYQKAIKGIIKSALPRIKENEGLLYAYDRTSLKNYMGYHNERNMDTMLMMAEFCEKYKGAMPEAGYTLFSKLRIPFETTSFDSHTEWAREYKHRIYWIVNEKTIRWAYEDEDVGYYPMNTPFSENYIEEYIKPYFDVLLNTENKVLVLKLK